MLQSEKTLIVIKVKTEIPTETYEGQKKPQTNTPQNESPYPKARVSHDDKGNLTQIDLKSDKKTIAQIEPMNTSS